MSFVHEHAWTFAAEPARVFDALTQADQLRTWFAEHAELGGAVGEPFRFWGRHTIGTPTPADADQVITGFDRATRLGFQWRIRGCPTEVGIALSAEAEATRLVLHHRVDGDLGGPRQRELIDDHWRLAFGNLSVHLAGRPGLLLPDYHDPDPEVRLSIVIEASPEAVWRALLEPEALMRWVGSPHPPTVEPWVGGRYDFGWSYQVDGKTVAGGPTRILEMDPGRRLVVDWPDWRGDPTVDTQRLTWELMPVAEGTRVTFVHGGFARPTDVSDYPFGWAHFLAEFTRVSRELERAG